MYWLIIIQDITNKNAFKRDGGEICESGRDEYYV